MITVTIDDDSPYNTSYDDPKPQSYRQWYQSPTLSDGSHKISLDNIAGTSLDYIVVTAGNSTPLAETTVIVDDNDPAIVYTGSWAHTFETFGRLFPFGNGTHSSTNPGDTATFMFTGKVSSRPDFFYHVFFF